MSLEAYIPDGGSLQFKIQINEKDDGLDTLLQSAEIVYELNKIPTANFVFIQANPENESEEIGVQEMFQIGDEIQFIVSKENEETLFKGKIINLQSELNNSGNHAISVECKDKVYGLTLSGSEVSYDNNFQDNIEEIVNAQEDIEIKIDWGSWAEESVLKSTNTTDWDYIASYLDSVGQMLAVRNGIIHTIDINDSNQKSDYLAQNGVNVFNFSAEQKPLNEITKVTISRHVEGQENPEIIEFSNPNKDAISNELPVINLSECKYSTQTLELIAKTIVGRSIHSVSKGTIETFGNSTTQAGQFIAFEKVNPKIEEKTHLITKEKHVLENGCWKTEYSFGLESNQNFTQSVSNQTPANSSEARIGINNSMKGLHIGIISDLEDPEGTFRIQVKIPSISQNGNGIWARLSSLVAGNERGGFFIPEIGDEVLVGFINESMNNPVILGSLYHKDSPPPLEINNDNFQQGIVSKEKSTFVINDENKEIELSTQKGNKILISEKEKGLIIEDQNGNSIVMDDSGITIESSKDINIKAQGNLKVESIQNKMEASTIMELKGNMIKLN